MAALATMFNSRTDVPPRLFTTRATLSPVEHQIKIKLWECCKKKMANSHVLYSFDLNQYDLILIVQYVKKAK